MITSEAAWSGKELMSNTLENKDLKSVKIEYKEHDKWYAGLTHPEQDEYCLKIYRKYHDCNNYSKCSRSFKIPVVRIQKYIAKAEKIQIRRIYSVTTYEEHAEIFSQLRSKQRFRYTSSHYLPSWPSIYRDNGEGKVNIRSLDIPTGLRNNMLSSGVEYLNQLQTTTELIACSIYSLGPKSIGILVEQMTLHGMQFMPQEIFDVIHQ